jgi:hypothetical protein
MKRCNAELLQRLKGIPKPRASLDISIAIWYWCLGVFIPQRDKKFAHSVNTKNFYEFTPSKKD